MRVREQIAAFVLTIGLSLWILTGVWIISAASSRRARNSEPFPLELTGIIILIGGVLVFVGVVIAVVVHLTRHWGLPRLYPNATITALFCINPKGEITVHSAGYAPNELRYCARIRLLNGESDEFECSYALFQRLREGMIGRAVCKGNQLLAFLPDSGDLERG